MAGITAEDQVAKKPYKNQTAGWLGVVKLDHLGAQVGVSVPPFGTIWLTDNEAILTARAPADAKNNPFEEQMFAFEDQAGQRVQKAMRPLVLIADDRDVPGSQDRYVPSVEDEEPPPAHVDIQALAAARTDTEAQLARTDERLVPIAPVTPVLAQSSVAAVPPSHAMPIVDSSQPEEDTRESWVDVPDRTLEPQPGSLGGAAAIPVDNTDPVQVGSPTGVQPQAPAPQTVGSSPAPDVPAQRVVPSESAGTQTAAGSPSEQSGASEAPFVPENLGDGLDAPPSTLMTPETTGTAVAEETAATLPTGEETGAADTPTGAPVEGEFAAHEEVGSPDAPGLAEPSESGESS